MKDKNDQREMIAFTRGKLNISDNFSPMKSEFSVLPK